MGKYQRSVQVAAQEAGFVVEHCYSRLPAPILALQRICPNPKATVYVSAGMHGDEPSGPLTLLRMLKMDAFPRDISFVIFPLLNPIGMALNKRESAEGLDINRDYKRFKTPEARCHRDWLVKNGRRYDLSICLHEDWEARGYYIYELNPDREQSLAPDVLSAVEPIIGVDRSELIDGFPAVDGLIRPQDIEPPLRGDDYPEALYMMDHFTRHSYTFETPSNTDLKLRIAAHHAAMEAAIGVLRVHGHWFDI